jgi:Xylanase inhibitor C-terminal
MKVDDISLGVDSYQYDLGHGSFVDSGTTLVYAHDAIYNAFMSKVQEYCERNSNYCPNKRTVSGQFCFKYDQSIGSLSQFYSRFPTITFHLDNGFDFDWRPEDYLYEDTYITNEQEMYCFPLNQYPSTLSLQIRSIHSWWSLDEKLGYSI